MTQRTVDAVKQAAADNNLQGGVVSDPEALQSFLDDMAAVINNNANDTTRAWILSGGYKFQSGSISIPSRTFNANSFYQYPVVFPVAFSAKPESVQLTMTGGNPGATWVLASADSADQSGFILTISVGGTHTGSMIFAWDAK